MRKTIIAILILCLVLGMASAQDRTIKAQSEQGDISGSQSGSTLNASNRTVKAMVEGKINDTKNAAVAKGQEMIDRGKKEASERLDNLSDSLKKQASERIGNISTSLKIQARDRLIDVVAKTLNDKTVLAMDGHDVTVYGEVKFRNKSMFMGGREIKVMPDTASKTAVEQMEMKNVSVVLKDTGSPTYEVNGRKEAKILGIFDTEMKVKAEIDAETGKIIKEKKPWWAFIAS